MKKSGKGVRDRHIHLSMCGMDYAAVKGMSLRYGYRSVAQFCADVMTAMAARDLEMMRFAQMQGEEVDAGDSIGEMFRRFESWENGYDMIWHTTGITSD